MTQEFLDVSRRSAEPATENFRSALTLTPARIPGEKILRTLCAHRAPEPASGPLTSSVEVFNKSCYLFTATTESSVFGNLKGCKNVAGGKAAGRHPRRHSPNRFDPEGVTQCSAVRKNRPFWQCFCLYERLALW